MTGGVFGKRLFDLFFVVPGLLVMDPFLMLISIMVKLDNSGPVFFKQLRIGHYGQPFYIYKFRTMVPDAEKLGTKVTVDRDPRVTRIGAILRKYKLDELPQLINVLKGDMSLVGPRPEVPEYVTCYSEEEKKIVHSVLPGITDIAAIEFRNEATLLSDAEEPEKEYISKILPRKIELYKRYVKERSMWLDIKLILMTIMNLAR